MWWEFFLKSKTDGFAYYAYSRETHEADGMIRIRIESGEAYVVRACKNDGESEFAKETAQCKAYVLFKENFPERRLIACG